MDGGRPDGYLARAPTRDDFDRVLALFRAADIADLGEPDLTEEGLRFEWSFPELDLASDVWVIERNGDLCAYAFLLARDRHRRLDGWHVVHPDHRGIGLEEWLLDLVEGRAAEHLRLGPPGDRVVLHMTVVEPDIAGHELLDARGYEPARSAWKMQTRLHPPVPPVAVPDGIAVRGFDPERDARAVHRVIEAAFADHWGWVPRTFDGWSELRMASPAFDPALWFLATAHDEIVGVIFGTVEDGLAWVQMLGVLPEWRGRGIGECLLRRSFAEFASRGQLDVALDVDGSNTTGAVELYERVGMRAVRRYDIYALEPSGSDAGRSSST